MMKQEKSPIRHSLVVLILFVVLSNTFATETAVHHKSQLVKGTLSELISNGRPKVLIAFSPKCPVCFDEILQVNRLSKMLDTYSDSMDVVLLFPAKFKVQAIKKFLEESKLTYSYWKRVPTGKLLTAGFSVTPEAKVYNSTGNLIYSGKISNLYEALGVKRTAITHYYTEDAIKSLFKIGNSDFTSQTTPVGCFISSK